MSDGRFIGTRAAVYFQPQMLSRERICAGIVLVSDEGPIKSRVALSKDKLTHAFGASGHEAYVIAHHLVTSLVAHIVNGGDYQDWRPPFEGASVEKVGPIEGSDTESLLDAQVKRNSMMASLLSAYEIPDVKQQDGIVKKVRQVLKHSQSKHLVPRFHKELTVKSDAMPLRVEFLGANYACYFLQLSASARGMEESTKRAHGKLFELQSVERFFMTNEFHDQFEERPRRFELLVVGDESNSAQRSAWRQIESLADRSDLRTRLLRDPSAAADTITRYEKAA